jgi:hypothetical protein
MTEKIDRRGFIKTTTAGAVAAGLAFHSASASARVLGANERVAVGFMGAGRMGDST